MHTEQIIKEALLQLEIKGYNVTNNGRNFFDQPVKNDKKTHYNIRKITDCHGNYYTFGCLLDYFHFKNFYKMIAIDLDKQQKLHQKHYNKLILMEI